jgi:hypothetical protein
MKARHLAGRPIERTDDAPRRPLCISPEAVAVYIERAWMSLPRAGTKKAPAAVYLSSRGVVVGDTWISPGMGRLVGFYDQRIHLDDFRADVFDVFEQCRGQP